MRHLKRYKKECAISPKLDQFIIDNSYKYPYDIVNEYNTLVEITDYYNNTGRYAISNVNCNNTIFKDSSVNIMFRAWHDSIHIKYQYDFDIYGELNVYNIMQSQLPDDYNLERVLLYGDIVGQTLYFNKYQDFPINQRDFIIDFLSEGLVL